MGNPREIVNALRRGVPPEYDLGLFSVGREATRSAFVADLESVRMGATLVRYLDADFGQGKTHLLKSLREEAFQHDFVVAIVELSAGSCPLFSLTEVYRQIVGSLRTADSPRLPALESILDRWLDAQRDLPAAERTRILKKLPFHLQAALLAFLKATHGPAASLQHREMVLRYLTGEKLPQRDRSRLELFDSIADETALTTLASIAGFVRDLGYGGLCILLDEAEGIVSFSRSSQRSAAVGNLVRLVRMTKGAASCYFVYAATPSFFTEFGDREDLGTPGTNTDNLRLDRLTTAQIHELVDRIAALYAAAYALHLPSALLGHVKAVLRDDYGRVSDLTRLTIAAYDEHRAALA
jgi:hypothetical protein